MGLTTSSWHGTDHRHHQTDRGQDERRQDIREQGACRPSCWSRLDPLLFHLFTGLYKPPCCKNTGVPQGRPSTSSRCCANAPVRKILLARCYEEAVNSTKRYKEKPAGRDLDVGFVLHHDPPIEQRNSTPASTSTGQSSRTTLDAGDAAAIVAGGLRQTGRADGELGAGFIMGTRRCFRNCTTTSYRIRLRDFVSKTPTRDIRIDRAKT